MGDFFTPYEILGKKNLWNHRGPEKNPEFRPVLNLVGLIVHVTHDQSAPTFRRGFPKFCLSFSFFLIFEVERPEVWEGK